MFIRTYRPAPRRAGLFAAVLRALLAVLRAFLLLLVLVVPFPLVPKLRIPRPDRRNLPTEVMRKD